MLFTILLLVSGLSLSAIAAVYAIIGLLSIFPAAPITIIIMGTSLEFSKLVVASWLYRNWKEIPILLKSYFSIALIVLMFLTSMSIFGYLSKSHMDSNLITGESIATLSIVDEKINIEKENILTQKDNILQSKKALSQMDAQVNEMMSRTGDDKGASKAIAIRKNQKIERNALIKDISIAQSNIARIQDNISKLQIDRAPLASSVRKVEAEVGPIKYIANVIYGDNIDNSILEKSVRGVILLIVFVFDPLAVLLLIAANWNMVNRKATSSSESPKKVADESEHLLSDQLIREPISIKEVLNEKEEQKDIISSPSTVDILQDSEKLLDSESNRTIANNKSIGISSIVNVNDVAAINEEFK